MATYKGIQGYSVQKLSSDPTASEASGQLWYNSGSGKFKVGTEGAGAWASGTAINTPRDEMASGGTQSAAWGAGGEPPNTAKTEIYQGRKKILKVFFKISDFFCFVFFRFVARYLWRAQPQHARTRAQFCT